MEPIRVILVDNEEVFREGLTRLLNEQPHIEVIHHCANCAEAIQKTRETQPDIVLIDGHLSEGKILEAISSLKESSPDAKVVIIGRHDVKTNPVEALKAGARACLSKSVSFSDMLKSLELISRGRIIISPVFVQKFLDEITSPKRDKPKDTSGLSHREKEIARLVANGASNRDISKKLYISESTAKVHIKNILKKLDLRNRQQLAVYAVLQNWVSSNSNEAEIESDPA